MVELNMYTGNSMTAADDAIIYNSLISGNGIIKGCEITFLGANQVNIASGHGIVKGRKFTVQEETIRVALASSATVPGRLYLHMDLSDTETPLQILSVAQSTLPDLIQDEDCNYTDGIYEIELATYTAGLTAITDLTSTFNTVKGIEIIESLAITEPDKIMGGKTASEEFTKINQSLNNLNDDGIITSFEIKEDGMPYINYKVGADTVSKKLGKGVYPFTTSYLTANISYAQLTLDVSSYSSVTLKSCVAVGSGRIAYRKDSQSAVVIAFSTTPTDNTIDVTGVSSLYLELQAFSTYGSKSTIDDIILNI